MRFGEGDTGVWGYVKNGNDGKITQNRQELTFRPRMRVQMDLQATRPVKPLSTPQTRMSPLLAGTTTTNLRIRPVVLVHEFVVRLDDVTAHAASISGSFVIVLLVRVVWMRMWVHCAI